MDEKVCPFFAKCLGSVFESNWRWCREGRCEECELHKEKLRNYLENAEVSG